MGAERRTAAPGTWTGPSESGRIQVARPPGSGGRRAGRCRRPPGRAQQPGRREGVDATPGTHRVGLGPTRPSNRVTSRPSPRPSGKRVPRNASLPLQPPRFQAFPLAPQGTPSPHLLRPSLHPVPRVSSCPDAPPAQSQSTVSFAPAPARTPCPPRVCCLLRDGLPQSPRGQPVRRPNLPQQPTPSGTGRGRSNGGKEALWASRCSPSSQEGPSAPSRGGGGRVSGGGG